MNDVQSERGKRRLAAARKTRSAVVSSRTSGLAAYDRQLVTRHDDLQVLELAGTKPKTDLTADGRTEEKQRHVSVRLLRISNRSLSSELGVGGMI